MPGTWWSFSLNLSVGDISEDVPGPKRQAELTKLYSFVVDHMEEDCNTLLSQAGQALTGFIPGCCLKKYEHSREN